MFQGIIYNYYVDKSLSYDFENELMNIGIQYKRIGVMFSEIGWVLFDVFLVFLSAFIVISIVYFIRKKNDESAQTNH